MGGPNATPHHHLTPVGFHPTYLFGAIAYLSRLGGLERHPTPPSHPCWVSPNLLFGAIAYLSRLGGGTEPNATISPLLGFTQPTIRSYRLKKPLYMSARFPILL
ncbi:hypothetical protein AB3M80_02510 [Arthrospira platensis BEA 1257B]